MSYVLVYGHVWRRNFGDELMTLLVALFLKKLGVPVVVYNLRSELAEKYQLKTSGNLVESVQRSSLLVIAGGATLSLHRNPQVIKNGEELFYAVRKATVPVFAMSVGGDNYQTGPLMPLGSTGLIWREGLFKATIRNYGDFKHLQSLGIDAEYAPDMLWSLYYLRTALKQSPVLVDEVKSYIAIGWGARHLVERLGSKLLPWFLNAKMLRFTTTPSAGELPRSTKGGVLAFQDPFDLAGFLQQSICVIDGQLHPGVTALALGTPNLCVMPNDKSLGFYNEMNWEHRLVTKSPVLLRCLLELRSTISEMKNPSDEEVAGLAEKSLVNFQRLVEIVESHGFKTRASSPIELLSDLLTGESQVEFKEDVVNNTAGLA